MKVGDFMGEQDINKSKNFFRVLEKNGFYYKVEDINKDQEIYKVKRVSTSYSTEGIIYYDTRDSVLEKISFVEAEEYSIHNVEYSQFRQ